MKKFSFLIFCLTFIFASQITAQKTQANTKVKGLTTKVQNQTTDGPVMDLATTVMDYGTIEQDSDPYRFFNFTNTGNKPLVIKHAKGSCGCTVPEYPKEPIMPGEASQIKVRYATNRLNSFTKTITLTTNEGEDDEKGMKRVLTIKGKVLAKAPEPDSVPKTRPSIFAPGS